MTFNELGSSDTDFLDCWEIIERSRLFDDGWKMSSQWLAMPPDAHLTPWSMGDLSCEYGNLPFTSKSAHLSLSYDRYRIGNQCRRGKGDGYRLSPARRAVL